MNKIIIDTNIIIHSTSFKEIKKLFDNYIIVAPVLAEFLCGVGSNKDLFFKSNKR